MSVSIGTNTASLIAAHHLRSNRQELQSAMTRLASGNRINSAADDAASVGVASSLKAQARSLDQAMKSAQMGMAEAQVADSALVEIENMVVRIRELAVQKASTGVYTTTQIANITAEITHLNSEISSIASNTMFNGSAVSAGGGDYVLSSSGTATTFTFPTFITTGGTTVSAADTALGSVATARGTLGAMINRLQYSVNSCPTQLQTVTQPTGLLWIQITLKRALQLQKVKFCSRPGPPFWLRPTQAISMF